MKKLLKAMVLIFGVDLASNLLLLLFLDIPLTKQTFMSSAIFTVVLALILKQFDVLKCE